MIWVKLLTGVSVFSYASQNSSLQNKLLHITTSYLLSTKYIVLKLSANKSFVFAYTGKVGGTGKIMYIVFKISLLKIRTNFVGQG